MGCIVLAGASYLPSTQYTHINTHKNLKTHTQTPTTYTHTYHQPQPQRRLVAVVGRVTEGGQRLGHKEEEGEVVGLGAQRQHERVQEEVNAPVFKRVCA